jgi:hypothetical protein
MKQMFRKGILLFALLACLGPVVPVVRANQVDLSLNLQYNDRLDKSSGGTWSLVAKADQVANFGIASVSVKITGVSSWQAAGPTGQINAGQVAGFNFLDTGSGDTEEIQIFQFPFVDPSGTLEQSCFYGVGTLSGGAPDYAGKPAESQSIGPMFSTLTDVEGEPWGVTGSDFLSDPQWDIAVPLVEGLFAAGLSPSFVGLNPITQASVFSSLPLDINSVGTVTQALTVTNVSRDDFVSSPVIPGDYNQDGVVDAADYTMWQDTLGQFVLGSYDGADGNGNTVIDLYDYQVWKQNFGNTLPASGSGVPVPEPPSLILAVLIVCFAWNRVLQPSAQQGVTNFQKNVRNRLTPVKEVHIIRGLGLFGDVS